MKLLNKSILIAIVALLTVATYAQEEEEPAPTFSVAGSVDTYFRAVRLPQVLLLQICQDFLWVWLI